jgi:hypothetical protein
MDM